MGRRGLASFFANLRVVFFVHVVFVVGFLDDDDAAALRRRLLLRRGRSSSGLLAQLGLGLLLLLLFFLRRRREDFIVVVGVDDDDFVDGALAAVGARAADVEAGVAEAVAGGAGVDEPVLAPDAVEVPAGALEVALLREEGGVLFQRAAVDADAQLGVLAAAHDAERAGDGRVGAVVGKSELVQRFEDPRLHEAPRRRSFVIVGSVAGRLAVALEEREEAVLEVVGVRHVRERDRMEKNDALFGARHGHVEALLVQPADLRRRLFRRGDHRQHDEVALVALERRRVPEHEAVSRELRVRQFVQSVPPNQTGLFHAQEGNHRDALSSQRDQRRLATRTTEFFLQIRRHGSRFGVVGLALLAAVAHAETQHGRTQRRAVLRGRQLARLQRRVVELRIRPRNHRRHAPEVLRQRHARVGHRHVR
mmetsp:Transcript_17925/g.54828  ORF Transcript_17925/g.54828 Transcript_17925/m.54828 type:complete len:421 (+) Transcript_17925:69-1331(+)